MRAVIQRVKEASITIEGEIISKIEKGLLVLIGIEDADTHEDSNWLSKKIVQLRIFDDQQGIMNYDLKQVNGDILAVSQFTLFAAVKKGNRPSYIRAAKPDFSKPFYDDFTKKLELELGKSVKKGIFGADMKVQLINDGPVTILVDTKNKD